MRKRGLGSTALLAHCCLAANTLVSGMALTYTIVSTVTTVCASGYSRLFHGTLPMHIPSLGRGIDFTKGDGAFWATPDPDVARYYASVAEQQLLFTTGAPGQAILAFDLPVEVLNRFEEQEWIAMYSHGIRFTPACSGVLHEEMTNIEVTFEQ